MEAIEESRAVSVQSPGEKASAPAVIPGRALTPKQEQFARLYAAGATAVEAYTAVYNALGSSRATVRCNASRLVHDPRVSARVRELVDAATAGSVRSTAALVADLEQAVEADPSELMAVLVGACRYCHGGPEHAYQWATVGEYTAAVEAAARDNAGLPPEMHKPLPDFAGGVGYSFHADPHPDCPSCNGLGVNKVRFNSSDSVSPGARRLLRGVELHPDGSLKRLHIHDQHLMRVELHRLRGLHVDRSVSVNLNANAPSFENMTREQQHAFLEALRPTK